MSRIYKFRAWDKRNKVMIYELSFGSPIDETEGYSKLVDDGGDVFLVHLSANGSCEYECILDGEIMQYTGLHDKNERKIFDGDIIEFDHKGYNGIETYKKVVFYEEKKFMFIVGNRSLYNISTIGCPLEIIGNIYENPELLKTNTKEDRK